MVSFGFTKDESERIAPLGCFIVAPLAMAFASSIGVMFLPA
jgi:hypothetical protein